MTTPDESADTTTTAAVVVAAATEEKPVMVHVGPTRPHAVTFYSNQQKVNFQRISRPFYHDTPSNEVMVYFPLSELSVRDKADFEQDSLQVHFGSKLVEKAILRGVMVDTISKSCLHEDGSVCFDDTMEKKDNNNADVVSETSSSDAEQGKTLESTNLTEQKLLELEKELKAVNLEIKENELHREEVNNKLGFVEGMSRKVLQHDKDEHGTSLFMLSNPKWWNVSTWKEHLEYVEAARTANKSALREIDLKADDLREKKEKIEEQLRRLHARPLPQPRNRLQGTSSSSSTNDIDDDGEEENGEKQIQVIIIVLSVKEPITPEEKEESHSDNSILKQKDGSNGSSNTTNKDEHNGDYSLFVSYVMNHCGGWSAAYELHLHNETQEIDVRYNASASLYKGDDLRNVQMIFSSAAPRSYSGNVPILLPPWKAGIVAPKESEEELKQEKATRFPRGGGGANFGMHVLALADTTHMPQADAPENMLFAETAEAAIEPAVLEDASSHSRLSGNAERARRMRLHRAKQNGTGNSVSSNTNVSAMGGNTTFTLPTLQSLSANGEVVRFPLTSFTLQSSRVSFITTPSLQLNAYTVIHTRNTSEYLLLAGEASLFVDGSYIGKSQLSRTSVNEIMKLNFGVDNRIEVKREMISESKSKDTAMLRKVFGEKQVLRYGYRITLINKKAKPHSNAVSNEPIKETNGISVCVKEQLPISNDGELIVRMISPSPETYANSYYVNSTEENKYNTYKPYLEHYNKTDNNNEMQGQEYDNNDEDNDNNYHVNAQNDDDDGDDDDDEKTETRMKLLESEGEVHMNVFVPYGATVKQEFIYEIEAPQKKRIYGMEKQK